jgi:hypothetical protein
LRRLLTGLAVLALIAAAALAGAAVSSRLGPEQLRRTVEARLSAELGGPVSIGSVRPYFSWGLGVEIAGLRSADGALEAERIGLTLSPRSLLRGDVVLRRVDLAGLRARAARDAGGAWTPPLLGRVLARGDAGAAAPASGAAPDLRTIASRLPGLHVERSELGVALAGPTPRAIALRDVSLELTRSPLGGAPALRASGRIGSTGADAGGFELAARIERDGAHADLALSEADLAQLAPWLGRPLDLRGRVSGVAGWKPAASGSDLALELLARDLHAAAADGGDSSRLDLDAASARAVAQVEIRPEHIRVRDFEWSGDPARLAGAFSIARPLGEASALSFDLQGGPLSIPALRDLLLAATPEDDALRRNLAALVAGEIASFRLRSDATSPGALRSLGAARAGLLAALPADLSLELAVSKVGIALGGNEPIRGLEARLALDGDVLRIDGARARIGDRPLPELTVALNGVRAAAAALEEGVIPPPVPPLPGIRLLDRWIDSKRRPGSPPRWRRIDLAADWIEHPVLLRPLEQVQAVLAPANPGVHIQSAEGFWGGVRFRGKGSFRGGDKSSIHVDVSLSLPQREGRRRADAEAWGRAHMRWDLEKLGDFQAESLEGVAQAIGDRVELRRGEARLRPRGDLRGSLDVDLSRADRAPYRAKVELANGALSELMADLKMDGGAARGTAELEGDVRGAVVLEHPSLFQDMTGSAALRLREGEIHERMNLLFAIAQVSDTLNPFRSRETIPYERIDAPLAIDAGFASTEAFSLHGPALRMVGTGRVDLVGEQHLVESVIGIFYFKTLDRVIGAFPILNRMLLGPDDNLISTYFAVEGPWANPNARLIPTKSIASGPASFVLEGLPAFVRGGLSVLERALTPAEGDAAPPPSPAPPANPGSAPGATP